MVQDCFFGRIFTLKKIAVYTNGSNWKVAVCRVKGLIRLHAKRKCVVELLLQRGFNSRDFSEKKIIIERVRPTCELTELKSQTKLCVRKFNFKQYSKTKWLCSCRYIGKLFCWPCLLFLNEKNVWNKTLFIRIIASLTKNSAARHCGIVRMLYLYDEELR
jgi:hypothetical protein